MLKSFRQFIGLVTFALCVPLFFFWGISKAEKVTPKPSTSSSQPLVNQTPQRQMTTESNLRGLIENLKRESPDYTNMEATLRGILREQKTAATESLNRLGAIEAIEFLDADYGIDVYLVQFQKGRTIWEVGESASGQINVINWIVLQDSTLNNLPVSFI